MLFDAHIHVFPDKLKGKVFSKLTTIAKHPYYRDETVAQAKSVNLQSGITHCIALNIATNPSQQRAVNDFAIAQNNPSEGFYCFGSVHPLADSTCEELHRIKEAGLLGIKLHPDYQEFFSDDPSMGSIYDTCQKLGLIVSFHAGKDPYSPDVIHNSPAAIRKIADSYKNLTIIAAHMGGLMMYDKVQSDLCGASNVYFDTSLSSAYMDTTTFERLVSLHGIDKILFATDSPWSTATLEKDFIEKCNFSHDEKELIYFKNAFKMLGID